MLTWLKRYRITLLSGILLWSFVTRVYQVHLPEQYVFDEVYHAVTAKLISRNDPRAYEWWHQNPEPNTAIDWLHPPIAKYTQAVAMRLFGETSFGWRVSSVVFGVLVIYLTYLLAEELFGSAPLALVAAFLASLDGLLLVQSRVAMNDIHVTFFILLTLTLYVHWQNILRVEEKDHSLAGLWGWRKRLALENTPWWLYAVGLTSGLAMGTKWSGIFALGIVGLAECAVIFRQLPKRPPVIWLTHRVLALAVLPVAVYLLSYSHMFIQGKSLFCTLQVEEPGRCYKQVTAETGETKLISHFEELHDQILYYQTHLTATHTYQSRPWQWFLNLRPVWYHVQNFEGEKSDQTLNIYAFGNPLLYWLGAASVFATLGYVASQFGPWSPQQASITDKRLLFLLIAYLMVWLPWEFSPRIMFFYHYTPAVPLLAILLSFWLMSLVTPGTKYEKTGKKIAIGSIVATAVVFIAFYPHWAGIAVPKKWADTVYFGLKTWK